MRKLKYQIIEGYLLEELSSGKYSMGDSFHSDIEIAHRFSVTKMTVRKAFASLESAGYIRRKRGSGTCVISVPSCPQRLQVMRRCVIALVFPQGDDSKLKFNIKRTMMVYELSLSLEAAGYLPMLVFNDYSAISDAGVSGIIIVEELEPTRLKELLSLGIPIVSNGVLSPDIPGIMCDFSDMARRLVAFLHQQGHKRLLYTGYGDGVEMLLQRLGPFLTRETQRVGMNFQAQLTPDENPTPQLREIFTSENRPDAVLIANAMCTHPTIQLLKELKLVPGQDISLVCQGSSALAMPFNPPMSIIDSNLQETCRSIVSLLLDVIRCPDVVHCGSVCLYDDVLDRGSIMHRRRQRKLP